MLTEVRPDMPYEIELRSVAASAGNPGVQCGLTLRKNVFLSPALTESAMMKLPNLPLVLMMVSAAAALIISAKEAMYSSPRSPIASA